MNQLSISYEDKAKVRWKALSASAHYRDLQIAREIAFKLGQQRNMTTSDDVRYEMSLKFPDTVFGNWMGSVFERDIWIPCGFVKAVHKGSHSRMIRVWMLRCI